VPFHQPREGPGPLASWLQQRFLPAFGQRSVYSIDTLAVRGWLAGLVSGGLSPSRAKYAYYVLFAVLEAAIQAGALLRNPAVGIRVPRSRRREMRFLSAVEVELPARQTSKRA
jgi:site-specific recombinase XerC